jgi:hypothetical protein
MLFFFLKKKIVHRYVEVSAKTGENVVAAFDTLIALCAAAKQEKASQAT